MIWVNFKLIEKTFGDGAVEMAKSCSKVAKETGVRIVVVASPFEVYRISNEVGIETWIQHADLYQNGRWTGWLSANQAMMNGASGCLLNHSERKIPKGTLLKTLSILPDGCESMVCVRSTSQAVFWSKKKTNYLAYEPPELIGSQTASVATEKQKTIMNLAKLVEPKKLVVGAGIKSKEDIEACLKSGAAGVLVSSNVVESKDPYGSLLKLAEGFRIK